MFSLCQMPLMPMPLVAATRRYPFSLVRVDLQVRSCQYSSYLGAADYWTRPGATFAKHRRRLSWAIGKDFEYNKPIFREVLEIIIRLFWKEPVLAKAKGDTWFRS